MSIGTPGGVYPLATKNGDAIPLDVARPLSGVSGTGIPLNSSLNKAVVAQINIPIIVSIYSDQFAELVVEDTAANDIANFFLVPDTLYDLAIVFPETLGGTIRLFNRSSNPASMIVNQVQRWTQMDNQNYGVS